jgi:secreted trypsin-like serine protease
LFYTGTSACNGDSGGGLMFATPETGAWTLQGVVSLSIRRESTAFCDANYPTVFTRVSSFITESVVPWMYRALQPWLNEP